MTEPKKPPPEMWQEIYRVCQAALKDTNMPVRKALIEVGHRHGFTEQALIEAQIINPRPTPQPGALKGARRG